MSQAGISALNSLAGALKAVSLEFLGADQSEEADSGLPPHAACSDRAGADAARSGCGRHSGGDTAASGASGRQGSQLQPCHGEFPMTQAVNVPGVGTLNFPDGMSQPDMAAAIKKNYPQIHSQAPSAPRGNIRGQFEVRSVGKLLGAGRPWRDWAESWRPCGPDFATNLVNLMPEGALGPKLDIGVKSEFPYLTAKLGPDTKTKSPGQALQETLDKYTTAPQDRLGKGAETASSLLVGGMSGPKMQTAPNPNPGRETTGPGRCNAMTRRGSARADSPAPRSRRLQRFCLYWQRPRKGG